MKRAMAILFWAHLFAIPCGMWAQEKTDVPWYAHEEPKENGNDNPRGTTSLGMPLNAPLSPLAQHASWGLGLTAGAGYNLTRRHALVGDFLWNWLYPTNQTLRPIQVALHTNKVSGHGNLFAFTGGYKLELRGKALGTYFIGGGGGLTFRVGEAPYRMYVESRYHFAPTKNITTQMLIVSWGIRY